MLLLAPAALGAYLSRPQEHPLAARVYLLVGVAAQAGTAAALVAAATVGLAGPSGLVTAVLVVCTAVALAGFARVAALFRASASRTSSA